MYCVIVLDSPVSRPPHAVCAVYLAEVTQPRASMVAVQIPRLCTDCAVQNCCCCELFSSLLVSVSAGGGWLGVMRVFVSDFSTTAQRGACCGVPKAG